MAPPRWQSYMEAMLSSYTRRAVLGTLMTAAGASVLRADQTFDADVLIIGAGVAGLSVARDLRRAGSSIIVVEARDRIGGRVQTVRNPGAVYEAGALYIHWAERNPLANLASDAGIPSVSDAASGARIRSFESGVETTTASRAARMTAFSQLGALLDGDNVADVSIAAVAQRCRAAP